MLGFVAAAVAVVVALLGRGVGAACTCDDTLSWECVPSSMAYVVAAGAICFAGAGIAFLCVYAAKAAG